MWKPSGPSFIFGGSRPSTCRPEAAAAFSFRSGNPASKSSRRFGRGSGPGSDLVVTAGRSLKIPGPSWGRKDFAPGVFVSAVDYDSAWTGEALKAADIFVMDDLAQMRAFRDRGYFKNLPERIGDLGDLVSGTIPGRTKPRTKNDGHEHGHRSGRFGRRQACLGQSPDLGIGNPPGSIAVRLGGPCTRPYQEKYDFKTHRARAVTHLLGFPFASMETPNRPLKV